MKKNPIILKTLKRETTLDISVDDFQKLYEKHKGSKEVKDLYWQRLLELALDNPTLMKNSPFLKLGITQVKLDDLQNFDPLTQN